MHKTYSRFILVSILIFISWVSIESIFLYIAKNAEVSYTEALLKQARIHSNEIEHIQQWNTSLGTVYALSNTLQPNKYLKNNLLDLGTDKRFVKINPSWMLKMLSESQKDDSYSFKLVSNTPINPTNKAKGFYAQALKDMQISKINSNKEQYVVDKSKNLLKYIHPVYIDKACAKCHANLGKLSGGIAIELDASFYLNHIKSVWIKFWFITIFFTLIATVFLYFYKQLTKKSIKYENLNNNLEERISSQAKKFQLALDGSRLGYWHWNIKTHKQDVNSRWLNMLGLDRLDIKGTDEDWSLRIHPDDKEKIMPIISASIDKQLPYVLEFRMLHKNGHYIWIQGSGAVTQIDSDGKALELSGTHQDISDRKTLELKDKSNSLYLKTLFEQNPNIIIITDSYKIKKVNHAFFNLFTEYSSLNEFSQEHNCICDFFEESKEHDTISNVEGEWIQEVLKSSEAIAKITYAQQEHYFSVQAKKIYEHSEMNMMVTFNDVTSMYLLKQKFKEHSIVDALTNIYNRRHFNDLFPHELNRARRLNNNFSFAIIDVDNFKLYNDTYGHEAGDTALISITEAISKYLKRSTEIFFRLGGEEFGIIFTDYSKEKALEYSQSICKTVENIAIEHNKNSPYNVLTISIGLCNVTPLSNLNTNTIYKRADEALYKAKENGRNRVLLYDEC